jgi:hypothetical protein
MVASTMAVVLFGASVAASSGDAGAATVSSTQADIAGLQAQVIAGAERIHQLTLAYQQNNVESQVLSQQVGADQAEIAQLQRQVSGSQNLLRQQAIASYTGQTQSVRSGSSSPDLLAASPTADPSVQAEYLQVAAGDINNTVNKFQAQQDQLSAAERNLQAQQQASLAAASSTDQARQAALADAVAEQGRLGQLERQLQQLQAQAALEQRLMEQQRQRQAAANAAAAAAASAAAPQTQGLGVNGGIVAVVHSIVTPAPAPVAAPAPAAAQSPGYQPLGGPWLQLRECESSDNYAANTGNGFFGAYQFTQATWSGLGYPGRPDLESPQMQDEAAVKDQSQSGWGQWPACSAALGLH